jgi:cytochrome c-type biogenesis protein CcmH/NrfG
MGIAYDRAPRRAEAIVAFKRAHDLEPSNADYQAAAEDSGTTAR